MSFSNSSFSFIKTVYQYTSPISYSMIMARDSRGGIGLNNGLPWKGLVSNKSDMQWFREKTKGKVIVMGYNTWVSLGRKPLPDRVNIVISSSHYDEVVHDFDKLYPTAADKPENTDVLVFSSIDKMEYHLKNNVGSGKFTGGEIMVIGGAQLYRSFAHLLSRIYLTTFEGEFEADTFLHLDLKEWTCIYHDSLKYAEPVFQIWEYQNDWMKVEHEHKPAAGLVAEFLKEKEEGK